jgi:hypothetical protein
MDMRAEHQWKVANMTSCKWMDATNLYNKQLGGLKKNPRTLLDKLGEVERTIFTRIANNDFQCETHYIYFKIKR